MPSVQEIRVRRVGVNEYVLAADEGVLDRMGQDEALFAVSRWLDGGKLPYGGLKKKPDDGAVAVVIDNGGSAFPTSPDAHQFNREGMSLRDWFAGQALKALVDKAPLLDREGEHGPRFDDETLRQFRKDMAESAYAYADWMLEVRKR